MPRQTRIAIPGLPHHVTQRGNRRDIVFTDDIDRHVYLKLLRQQCKSEVVKIWAWSMMDNHVHLIVVPEREDSMSRALRNVHGEYAGYFNARHVKSGHLWQGRFKAAVLDERHLWNAVRYVERNPVRAGMVARAEDYRWSSAAAHCGLRQDPLISNDLPLLHEISDWAAWLAETESERDLKFIRDRTRTCRPCTETEFAQKLEVQLNRKLLPQQPGRKKNRVF